ncbi:MAG: 4-(cytidine 5'-diphospho)-2-C-methyl-D-erythritol kinase [Lentisphaeria bacterium]|nr:4-(cytidine 5'-diphospho)-2-C-methyl-D-erythritol kinase [Lentisphaeria bacterium]
MPTLEAPGKINLYLEIKGKRPDSYHELLTLFYPVTTFTDLVQVEFSDTACTALSCSAPGVPVDQKNICCKAADKYFDAAGMKNPGLHIHIEKKIPVAAGMGGGSSDAAAVLLLLQQKFQALTPSQLAETALAIGADVPFFLNPKPALARGRGEQLSPVDLPDHLPLLILPTLFPVSAAWAYRYWNQYKDHAPASSDPELLIRTLQKKDFAAAGKLLRNDLAPAVVQKFPVLTLCTELFAKTGGSVLLSGSGPTLFALYPDFETQEKAYRELSPEFRKYELTLFQS